MSKLLKTLLLSLLLFCMVCPAISYAGATPTLDIVLDGTFTTGNPWVAGAGTTISGNAAWIGTGATPESIVSQPTITFVEGKTYKVGFTVTNTSLTGAAYAGIQASGGTAFPITADGVYEIYIVAGSSISSGFEITAVDGAALDTMTIDNISVIVEHYTTSATLTSVFATNLQTVNAGADVGPGDEYAANGTQGGQVKYTSDGTHPDGAGGAAQVWDLWWDGSTDWIISPDAGTKGANHWKLTAASPIGTFTPVGDVTGAGEVTYGPADHSEETGSAGLETDGVAGYVDLKTSYDFLNGLRAGKFGIVNIYEVCGDVAAAANLISGDSVFGTGYRIEINGASTAYSTEWSGTNALDEISVISFDVLAERLLSFDVGVSDDAWIYENGILIDSATTVNGLDACKSTFIRLAATANETSRFAKAKFGFMAILDFTAVTTVDAAWNLGLSAAINTAAVANNYDPHAIAAAIYAYDNNITGVYYALNELSSGDASSYYLLAYDITDSTAKTSEFYGLVSASGVTGAVLVESGGGGRYDSEYRSIYRPRYNGGGR